MTGDFGDSKGVVMPNITLAVKNLEKTEPIQNFFQEHTTKVIHHLGGLKEDLVSVHGNLERSLHRDQFDVSVTVCLGKSRLNAKESSHDLFGGMNNAFASIMRQGDKLKGKLIGKSRKDGLRKRNVE